MKKLQNTLYVTTPNSYISKDGTNIVVLVDDSELGRIPIHNLQSIICFGYMGMSPAVMRLCVENGVAIAFMTPNGRFQASVLGETKGNVLLRREQYRMADDISRALDISKNLIKGKFMNSRYLLRRGKNDHNSLQNESSLDAVLNSISNGLKAIDTCQTLEELRGIEGNIAKLYFSGMDELILKQKDVFFIRSRNKRPPTDRMNSLLSFLYTLLAHDVASSLEAVGLDSFVGFLHTDRPGRRSLAFDVMEEMRSPIVDRLALNLVNLGKITGDGFLEKENGSIIMSDNTRKIVLESWQSRKNDEILHPFLGEKIKTGLIPHTQSMLLARYIRGDLDGYPPFIMKSVS